MVGAILLIEQGFVSSVAWAVDIPSSHRAVVQLHFPPADRLSLASIELVVSLSQLTLRAIAAAGAVKFVSLKEYLAVAKTQGSAPTVNYIDRKARAAASAYPPPCPLRCVKTFPLCIAPMCDFVCSFALRPPEHIQRHFSLSPSIIHS